MLWIIQENLYNENKRGDLVSAVQRLSIPHLLVDVSGNKINKEIPKNNELPIITNGSIMLSNIALANNWEPGSLINNNFSYDIWQNQYHEFLLNKNATVSTLAEAQMKNEKAFIRPVLDNKTFNGRVFNQKEFLKLKQDSIEKVKGSLNPETRIMISEPKTIGQEHRHYIVDGEIITSSRYKFSGQPNFKEGCDDSILEVVQQAINKWTPSRAFVLDSYISGDEIGIVEIGGICHAGLYEANIMKLVHSLDSMQIEPKNTNKNKKFML